MKLLTLLSAVFGLSAGVRRPPSRASLPAPTVQIGTPDLDTLITGTKPSRGVWHSPFDRAEHRQGRKFRSQRERSNRRKASR